MDLDKSEQKAPERLTLTLELQYLSGRFWLSKPRREDLVEVIL